MTLVYQHPKNVRGAIKTAENILYTARTSRRSTFYTTNHYIYPKGFIHCSTIRLYSRLTDLSLKEFPCVFNIVATCLITLFDTANVIARERSYNYFNNAISIHVAHTNPVLPTSVKYYLGESLRHIIPCLGTFRHNEETFIHHHLCSIQFPAFRISSLSSAAK